MNQAPLQTFGRRPWERWEDKIILGHYASAPRGKRASTCVSLLPNRTKEAIKSRARNLVRVKKRSEEGTADMTIREKVALAIDVAAHGMKGHDAIATFLEAAAEPDENGIRWHMRPDEATEEMLQGACKTHKVGESMAPGKPGSDSECPRIVGRRNKYRAMLADPTAQFEWDR